MHVHASTYTNLCDIEVELNSIRCKHLVQDNTCAKKHDRRASFICKSRVYKFPVHVSWECLSPVMLGLKATFSGLGLGLGSMRPWPWP